MSDPTPLDEASRPLVLLDGMPAGMMLEAWIHQLAADDPRRGAALIRLSELLRPIDHRRTLARDAALVGRRTVAVAVHRPRTAALGIAAVGAVLLTVLFYLSQLLQVHAARFELDNLAQERFLLTQEMLSQDGVVTGLGAPYNIVSWAEDRELEDLRVRHLGAR